MDRVDDVFLDNVVGGSNVSGTLMNAFTSIVKFIYEVGEGIGSSIRRISEGDLCPLKWLYILIYLS